MTWFAVIDKATGEAVSFGTVIADPLPAHLEAVEVEGQPKKGVRAWDAATRTMVPHVVPSPAKTAVEEKLDAALAELATVKTKLDAIDGKVTAKP